MTECEALQRAIGAVLFNANNFPEKAQSRLLGQDMRPLNDKLVDAILAAGYSKVEITDEMVERAVGAWWAADDISGGQVSMRAALTAVLGGGS